MATIPKICYKYEADASKVTVNDDTGAYVLDFNDNGYGAPNTERADVAGVLLVYYQPSEGTKTLITPIEDYTDYNDTYENTYESSFEVPYSKDGWYQYNYILVPTSVTPVEGAIFYDTNASQLRQYDVDLNPVEIYDESFLLDTNEYTQVNENDLATAKLNNKKSVLSREYIECRKCVECGCDEQRKTVTHIREGITSAKADFNIARYEAQETIERLTKQYRIK